MDFLRTVAPYIVDAVVIMGVIVMTIGVFGLATMQDVYIKLHAASQAVFLGAIALMVASFATLDSSVILRASLIIAALLITSPVSAHAIANAAIKRKQQMRTENPVNESPFELDRPDPTQAIEGGSARLRALLGE